jgi:cobalt-zinc-cadmium efflux system protein
VALSDHHGPNLGQQPDANPGHQHSAHQHSHSHSHSHASVDSRDSERRVLWVMVMTGGFMVAEVVGGVLSGSLALLADAAHMASDSAALLLAWLAFRVARRPPSASKSYGWHRVEVLAAFVNGLTLLVLAAWIGFEAVGRLFAPAPVQGDVMGVVAILGLLVNVLAAWILHRGAHQDNLNMRAALLHVLGDLLGSVAAIVAAGVILLSGWTPIDPLLSLLVAGLVVRGGWDVVRRSSHILLEGTPEAVAPQEIAQIVQSTIEAVVDVHHLHLWSLSSQRLLLTVHVTIKVEADPAAVLADIHRLLQQRFGIAPATVQIETQAKGCVGQACDASTG